MRRLAALHPEWPVRILCGELMDEPMTVGEMAEEMPQIREFFVRLADTTGQAVGEDFLRRLEPGYGENRMYSPEMALPLRVLKERAPGHALEQIEAFQHAFYGQGRDVLDRKTQHEIAAEYGVGAADFDRAMRDESVQAAARAESVEAAEIMGEFVLYPTLYLETGSGEKFLLARGYASYEAIAAALEQALSGGNGGFAEGAACGVDGVCG